LVLDNVTVTANSIQFHNVTSLGTNFTNTNETFDAVASFFGLQVGFTITNVNESNDLFNSTAADQEFNATFTPGQVIRTINSPDVSPGCTAPVRSVTTLIVIVSALALVVFSFMFFISKKELPLSNISPKIIVMVFVGLVIGVVLIQAIANQIVNFCPV